MMTYADYLRSVPQGSEGGSGVMSEQQWNQLPPDQQWATIGGGFMMDSNDSRYAGLAGLTGGRGGNIVAQGSNPNDSDFTDPGGVHHGQGFSAYDYSNLTPEVQAREGAGGLSDKEWAILAASMFGGAALAGGSLAGAGAAEGLGGVTASGSAGVGAGASGSAAFDLSALGGASGAGDLAAMYGTGEAGAGAGSSLSGMYSPSAGTGAFAGGSAAPGAGVVAPGMQGAASLDSFLINNGMAGMAGTDTAGLIGNAASSAGSSIMNNPSRALQLASLLGSVGGGLASDNDDDDNGPSELGSMGWKPPEMGEYHPAMYDPQYQSPFTGWMDQYQQSLKPLGRMYGR